MELTLKLAAVFGVAMLAGMINSIAGGGTLLTFPSLLAFGMDGKIANATSTLGLWPATIGGAFGYRDELRRGGSDLGWFMVPSFLGGLTGAVLLLVTGSKTFDELVPWLILGATALFMAQRPISRWLEGRSKSGATSIDKERLPKRRLWTFILPLQFVVATYGGYFGAGMGILMLATLGLMGIEDIHHRNGIKNLAGMAVNGVALVTFIVGGLIDWQVAATMAGGSLYGGYISAGIAKRIGPQRVRWVVIAVGLSATAYTAWRLVT